MKNGVWNGSQTMWDSFQTSDIIVENLSFLCIWNLCCLRRNVPGYACFGSSMQAVTYVRRPRATLVILFWKIDFCTFKRLYFPFLHSSSQHDIWLGSKLALDLRVWASLGNGGSSHKGYKMQCLQMPHFWLMSFANGIKRIRDKTFCFNLRFGPKPRLWHISHIHGMGCNSEELRGIYKFEVPPLLLGKQER